VSVQETRIILGGVLGECVHVAGVLNFLSLAEGEGYRTLFTGPATSVDDFVSAIQRERPDIVAVSYRLTPENAHSLLMELGEACSNEGLVGDASSGKRIRYVFGGTPPVAAIARETGLFEAVFSGQEPPEAVIAYLRGQPWEALRPDDYPSEMIPRIRWKAPYPVLRHHFGLPASTIEPTVHGIEQIAAAEALDIVSLGPDQDAQENLFRPERIDPRRKGAGGVPFRNEVDLERLYAASRCGNYPLMRSYSGTDDLLSYAEVLRRTIRNAWCATSLFWFNVVDGRGPLSLRQSIADHMALMRWHGERGIPVEGNEPHHWELRDAHDAVACAAAYLYAYVAKAMGVSDYIATYMFETPPHLSNRMDLAKQMAKLELAESLADGGFRVWRQTRTGLMSYPTHPAAARGHLGASIFLQMALQPQIVHVVGYCEADHAARPEEVIESCYMARRAIENALRGAPDTTADPVIQQRKATLMAEAMEVIAGMRELGQAPGDPLLQVETLAQSVETGLLDAPNLRGSPYACGHVQTRAIEGAIVCIDEQGRPLGERERVARLLEAYQP